MTTHQRKRASIQVPLVLIAEALGLPDGVYAEFIYQDAAAIARGMCEIVVGGDVLDPSFLTYGPPLSAALEFTDGESGPVGHIIPVDQQEPGS